MEPGRMTAAALCSGPILRSRLAAHGFHFSKRHGQNFLTAVHVTERMAETVGEGSSVLEIGPGFGALTAALCETGVPVCAVELDKRLLPLLRENVGGYPNLNLIQGDALRTDLAALMPAGTSPMVCANLPYQITTPILAKLLEEGGFDPLVVMVQREVAERLRAAPGRKDYGAFTVFCALYATVETLLDVPPDCFIPRPQVHSAVICLHRRPEGWISPETRIKALKLSRAAFALRRKTLANALSAGLGLSRDSVTEKLRAADTDPNLRGETLAPEDYVRLTTSF